MNLCPFITALTIALALASRSQAIEEDASTPHDEFLAKLQARDQQFDNVHLVYLMRGTNKIEDYSWKIPDRDDVRPIEGPTEYKYVYRDDLVVRGDDITHIRNVLEPAAGEGGIHMLRFSMTSNVGGIRTELALEGAESNRGLLMRGDEKSVGFNSESHLQMVIEFALGFGFARRMTKIETLGTTDTGFHVTGRIELGPTRDFPCSLELDRDLVVRRAVVDVPNRRMEVTTKDSETQGGFVFAETGRMRNFAGDEPTDGYFIIFQEAHFNLTDNRYQELTTMEVPAGVGVPH